MTYVQVENPFSLVCIWFIFPFPILFVNFLFIDFFFDSERKSTNLLSKKYYATIRLVTTTLLKKKQVRILGASLRTAALGKGITILLAIISSYLDANTSHHWQAILVENGWVNKICLGCYKCQPWQSSGTYNNCVSGSKINFTSCLVNQDLQVLLFIFFYYTFFGS